MKYFTPQLLIGFMSEDDEIADAANKEMELGHGKYLAHLETIRPSLTENTKNLIDNFCLHDSKVLTVNQDGREFSIVLRLDSPRDKGIQIDYSLLSSPKPIVHPSFPKEEPVEWLYDEIDVQRIEAYSVFIHSIFFTGGLELQLVFSDLKIKTSKVFSFQGAANKEVETILAKD